MASETGRGESGVGDWFLYDGLFEPPLYRIKRAPSDKILALRASRAAVLVRAASRKLDVAMERAGTSVQKRRRSAEAEDYDESRQARADPRRVAEILAPLRREFDAMHPDEQERFLDAVMLFAAERIKLSEWFKITQAVKLRCEATLPAPIPPGRAIKAKDRPRVPAQGW